MDTVNRYSQSGCFKTCFGHGYGCVRKNWGTVPRSTIAFPFDDHLGPRPIFEKLPYTLMIYLYIPFLSAINSPITYPLFYIWRDMITNNCWYFYTHIPVYPMHILCICICICIYIYIWLKSFTNKMKIAVIKRTFGDDCLNPSHHSSDATLWGHDRCHPDTCTYL